MAKTDSIRRKNGPANNNWQGGRSVASNGYVLIRIGVGHPLADCRGYCYEHRLIASGMIGRWLKPSELVHHRDGNKQNNHPANLDVKASNAEHYLEHRKPREYQLRLPGEGNPLIACACGCGSTFEKFDYQGRPRRYLPGHNTDRDATTGRIAGRS
jgi:hypothetical protein